MILTMKAFLKKSILLTIILTLIFSFPFLAIAQEIISPPKIDNILTNNELITIHEEGIIYGLEGDAIRIGGLAEPGDEVIVTIADKEYKGVANIYHDWFVLFSITNFEQESYIIEARATRDGKISTESTTLRLIIGEEPVISQLDDNSDSSNTKPPLYPIILIVLGLIFLSTFVWFMISRKKN